MVVIGIDSHRDTLAACAVNALGAPLAERTFSNNPDGHAELEAWAGALGAERIGIEGSGLYGAAAGRTLVAGGWMTCDVPPHLSHRERIRTHRAGKSDPTDALAIARVTARETTLPPIRLADRNEDLGLLVTARDEAIAEATQVRNRLHAELVVLLPGYAATIPNLVAARNRGRARSALGPLAGIRAELARERLERLDALSRTIDALERRISGLVADHPLLAVPGIRGLTAARLLAEAGEVRRFRSADAFAMFSGTAPIPASSGQTSRVRLNRGGNRQLNRAIHTIALAQARHHPDAIAYVARKRAEGRTWREAIRSLKRHLARVVYRVMARAAEDCLPSAA